MRLTSALLFAAGAVGCVLVACSSTDSTPAATNPDGSTSSSGGSSGDGSSGGSSGGSSEGSSGGADSGEPAYVKTTTETMQHEGQARKYIVSVPLDYDAAKKYPLSIWLHGNPGTAESAAGFRVDRVTKGEAIVVYPGSLVTDGWDHSAALQDNADTTFIFAVIDALKAKYSIDDARKLLSGWSGGGFMASLMACRYSTSFRAIGIHAGGAPFDVNGGANPTCDGAAIATLVSHGGQDTAVGGDSGFYAAEYWSDKNGCSGTRTATTPAPCEKYDGCPADKPVEYCFNANDGHGLWSKAIEVEWAWFKALP